MGVQMSVIPRGCTPAAACSMRWCGKGVAPMTRREAGMRQNPLRPGSRDGPDLGLHAAAACAHPVDLHVEMNMHARHAYTKF